MQGQVIYAEDDEIDGFYFMVKGLASFNLPSMSSMIFAVIDPEKTLQLPNMNMETFQYFGMEDSISNHIQINMQSKDGAAKNSIYNKGEGLLNKR